MPQYEPTGWGREITQGLTGDNTANIIGWIDNEGHKHATQPSMNSRNVEGLIVEYGRKSDPDDSIIRSVFKMSRTPNVDEWRRLIRIRAHRYQFHLEYEYDPDDDLERELESELEGDDDDYDEEPF